VFYTGAPGLDQVYHMPLLSKEQLTSKLGLDLSKPVLLVTYHPLTLEKSSSAVQVKELLAAIESTGFQTVFTKANADPQGRVINQLLETFCQRRPDQYKLSDNLGQPLYYSCLKHFALMAGNSSSGIIEAPSFSMPVVNIGDRQQDRVRAGNVVDVVCKTKDILRAIKRAANPDFRRTLRGLKNPYDRYRDGKTSWRIKEILRKASLSEDLIKKKFFDLNKAF